MLRARMPSEHGAGGGGAGAGEGAGEGAGAADDFAARRQQRTSALYAPPPGLETACILDGVWTAADCDRALGAVRVGWRPPRSGAACPLTGRVRHFGAHALLTWRPPLQWRSYATTSQAMGPSRPGHNPNAVRGCECKRMARALLATRAFTRLLGFFLAQAAAASAGGWLTERHSSHATTDIPCTPAALGDEANAWVRAPLSQQTACDATRRDAWCSVRLHLCSCLVGLARVFGRKTLLCSPCASVRCWPSARSWRALPARAGHCVASVAVWAFSLYPPVRARTFVP